MSCPMNPAASSSIRRFLAVALLAVLTGSASSFAAQNYPERPLRFIVPFAPGGGLDITARLVAPSLSESLGQPVVVDNRPGAGGAVGLAITAKAPADGHTLVMASASHVIQAVVLPKPAFDFFRDLAPVSEIISTPYLLVSYPGLPAKTVKELIAYARANPEKLVYGSAGDGTLQHLAMELFLLSTGTQALHVPYKGVGPSLPDLFAGRAHIMMSSLASLAPHVRSGAIRALAVTGSERSAVLPDLPTMAEAGVPGFVVEQWQGAMVPAGTPGAVVERLHREIVRALKRPNMLAYLEKSGATAAGSSPQAFRAKLEAERAKWAKVVSQAKLKP